MAAPPDPSPSFCCSLVVCTACLFGTTQSGRSASSAVNHGTPETNHSGRRPPAPALSGVSGRVLGSFTTFLPRPTRAGQRSPGSWGCAHTRLCLLRVASGRREGTINTARPGSETERRDPRAAPQPRLPLGCVTRNSASLGGGSSFDALRDGGITGPLVEFMGAADTLARNRAQSKPILELQAKNLQSILCLIYYVKSYEITDFQQFLIH